MERSSIQVLRTPAAAIGAMALAALVGSAAFMAFEGGMRPSAPLARTEAAEAPGPLAHAPVRVATPPTAAVRARAARFVQFEPNRGQADAAAQFVARSPQLRADVRDDGIDLTPERAGGPAETVRLRFADARRGGGFDARERGQGSANYLVGNDPSRWLRDLPYYKQLRYTGLYEGIDLVYYSRDGELEYDFVVQPNADPLRIRMKLAGKHAPTIDAEGNLRLDGADGTLRLHKPVLYQHIDGEKKTLAGDYVLLAKNEVGFRLPAYDRSKPLIIDPTFKLLYSTYLTGFHDEQVGGMALDAQGNAYVVGRTNSDDFVVSGNALQARKSTVGLQYNVVVTKFDASGALIYSTYLGGTGSDTGSAIAVDAAGNAYVTGNTTSRDFPVTSGAHQSAFTGSLDAYLSIVSPDGSRLTHSTLYGGTGSVQASAIAVDAGGAVMLAGTAGPGLTTTVGAYKTTLATGDGAFVAKFSAPAGGPPRLLAASYFAVDNPDANSTARGNSAFSMALDSTGAPWITGQAFTTNLPLTSSALQAAPATMSATCAPGPGPLNSFAFVARLSADLGSLAYASYLTGATEPAGGAACSEFGRALALDAAGNVYLTGGTASAAFPTTAGAAQPAFPSGPGFASFTGFVTKLRPDGRAILWSTYLGGNGGNTFPGAIATDAAASAVWTTSVTGGGTNYPITSDALQSVHGGGGADVGIVQLDAASGALKYSTYLGGTSADIGLALAVDYGGNAFVAGNTFSPNYPLTANAFERTFRPDFYGGADWFFSILGQSTISAVQPDRAGNSGDASIAVHGAGLSAGSTCRLEGPAAFDATLSRAAPDGTSLGCTFALDGKPAGQYTLVTVALDGTRVVARQPFFVAASSAGAEVWAGIAGRARIRAGVPAPYEVTYGNRGAVNAYGVTMSISWPKEITVTRKFELLALPPAPLADPTATAPELFEKDGRMHLLLFLPMLPAGRTFALPIEVTAPITATDVRVVVAVSRPLATSLASLQEAFAVASGNGTRLKSARPDEKPALTDGQACVAAAVNAVVSLVQALPPGRCVAAAAGLVANAVQTVAMSDYGSPGASGNAYGMGQLLLSAGQTALSCAVAANPVTAGIATVLGGYNFLLSAAAAADACAPTISAAAIQIGAATGIDPNDKSGPSGDGSAQHFAGSAPAAYQISFENLATAGLPAANVVIVDQLDSAKFDLSTLTLGSIAWGAYRIDVPPGLNSYATVYRVDSTISVRVQGSLNPTTGLLKWTFTTLDPLTSLPPSDPTLGFLPPDTDGMKGQGHVSFVVAPKAGLAAGTVLQNQASIVFDANAAILTPTWSYALDTDAPTSRVQSLTGKVGSTSFDVAWASPADSGSAVRTYTVSVSDNGGPFTVWQSRVSGTSATYDGVNGHTYAFNVVATDGAGNAESAKATAEASIAVNGSFGDTTGGSGGGCTIGGYTQRDAVLPLLVLLASMALAVSRRRQRRVQPPMRSHDAA